MTNAEDIPELQFEHFLSYSEVTHFAEALARAQPQLCRLDLLGDSRDSRAIHLLTITDFASGRPEDRPACLIHANIHAVELAGTHAALHVARQLLANDSNYDLLKNVTFYIIPRINPDAAEFAAATSARVRSRTDMANRAPNTVYPEDVNDDGLILTMRRKHADGDLVANPQDPRLLIRRQADSKGPFYRTLPEGLIHAWDGRDHIKAAGLHAWIGNDPAKVGGRSFDWNRSFPYEWRPESEQQGTGDYPLSEPEVRYMADFISSGPNIFGILGLHTGYAAIVRAPSAGPCENILDEDDRMMDELAKMGSEETGFVATKLIEFHPQHKPDTYRGGHFLDFAYHHLGLHAFDLELGWFVDSAGISTSDYLAVEHNDELDEHMRRTMRWWDGQEAQEPLFKTWEPFEHPQLGPVEIGGFLYTHLDNPAFADLAERSQAAYRFVLRLAQKRPQLAIEDVRVDPVDEHTSRIRLRLVNRGQLATSVTARGKALWHRHRITLEFYPAEGVKLASDQGHMDLEPLDADGATRELEWTVSGGRVDGKLCDIHIHASAAGNLSLTVNHQNRHIE